MDIANLTLEQWTDLGISLLIIVVVILIGRWLIKLVIEKGLKRLVSLTGTTLDDAILAALLSPLHWLVIVASVQYGADRLDFLPPDTTESLDEATFILYFVIGVAFLVRLTSEILNWYNKSFEGKEEMSLAATMLPFIRRVVVILIVLIAIVSLLSRYTDVSALLTTLGVGSLAIALAAQTALEDMFAGLLIMFDRPYLIGDRIEIQELDTWGDVIDISLRSTRIRTRDNRWVAIPNAIMGKSMIVNYTRPDTKYRIQIEIGIGYGTDVELARNTIIEAVRKVEGVLPDQKVEALFLNFGESAMTFRVRWWLGSYEDTRRMFDRVNTAMYKALNGAGIVIANRQVDTHHFIKDVEIEKFKRVFQPSQ
jgi:small-conductance mechanosensitive channel